MGTMNEPVTTSEAERLRRLGQESADQLRPSTIVEVERRAAKIKQRRALTVRASLAVLVITVVGVSVSLATTKTDTTDIGRGPTTVVSINTSALTVRAVKGATPAVDRTTGATDISLDATSSAVVGPVSPQLPNSIATPPSAGVIVVSARLRLPAKSTSVSTVQEIIVTDADAPTQPRRDRLFAVEEFSGHDTFGCRFADDGTVTCALYGRSGATAIGGGRIDQWSWFETGGSRINGGRPDSAHPWPQCPRAEALSGCLATVKITIGAASFSVQINDRVYFSVEDIPTSQRVPPRLRSTTARAYFGITTADAPAQTQIRSLSSVLR
jgi:hypothetical protein